MIDLPRHTDYQISIVSVVVRLSLIRHLLHNRLQTIEVTTITLRTQHPLLYTSCTRYHPWVSSLCHERRLIMWRRHGRQGLSSVPPSEYPHGPFFGKQPLSAFPAGRHALSVQGSLLIGRCRLESLVRRLMRRLRRF